MQSSMPVSCKVYYKLRTDKIQLVKEGTTLSGEDSNTILAGKQNEGKFGLEFNPANEVYDLFYVPLNENGEGPVIGFNKTIIRATLYRPINLIHKSFRVVGLDNVDVFRVGDPIQIGDEILVVSKVASGNPLSTTYLEVESRGDHGTDAEDHAQGATVILLRYSVPHNVIKLDGFLDSRLPLRVLKFLLNSTVGPLGNGIEVEVQLPDSQIKTLKSLQLQLSTVLWPEDLSNVTGLKDIKAKDNDGTVAQGGTSLTTRSSLRGFAGKYLYTHEGINLVTGEVTFGRCVVIDSVKDNGDGSWTADVTGDWVFRLHSGEDGASGTVSWIVADDWLTPGNTTTWVANKVTKIESSTGHPGDPTELNTHRDTIITGASVFGRCRLANWQGAGPWTYWDGVSGSPSRTNAILFEPGKIQAEAFDGVFSGGSDGSGLEFVFQRTATDTSPAAIITPADQLLLPNYVPSGWSDNPPTATSTKQFLWASVRTGTINAWSEFGAPLLWAVQGADGSGLEFVFQRTATDTAPTAIVTTTAQRKQDDFIPAGWSDSPPGATPTKQFLWASKRTGSTKNWGEFSAPTKWAVPGQDGPGTEFVYIRTTANVVPNAPVTTTAQRKVNDHVPTGWTDDPVGPDKTNPFEWVSARNGSTKNWGEFSTPAQWANYAVGVDGPGFEFVFKLTATSTAPATPIPGTGDDIQVDDYQPPGWTDNATGVSTATPFEWCSRRKKLAGVWGAFGTPFAFGKQGQDGPGTEFVYIRTTANVVPTTPTTTTAQRGTDDYVPTGWTDDPVGPDETNPFEWISVRNGSTKNWGEFSTPAQWANYAVGVGGSDGSGLEFVFQRTATDTSPAAIITPADQRLLPDYIPTDWYDNPPAATHTKPFLWASVRTGTINAWSEFGAPLLWAIQGADGSGLEFVFQRTSTSVAPAAIVTTSAQRKQDDFIPTGWSDSPPGASPTKQFLWVSMRTGSTKNWGEFSAPTKWAVPGQDGLGTEFIFTRAATNVVPGNPTTTTAQRKIDDHVPTGWTDDPVGPDETNPFEWISARTGSTKNWGEFSTPAQWANYAVGVDGPGFEFVFSLSANSTSPLAPTSSKQQDDYIPSGWTDNATGVSTATPFEWCSRRKKLAGVWGAFGTPFIFGKEGPQGTKGPAGGEKGGPGDRGIKGERGIQGDPGAKGNVGDKGFKGVRGIQGSAGPKGNVGDKGFRGVQGIQGSAGPKGNVGSRGFRGVQGIQGSAGPKGSLGSRGFRGIQGIQGGAGAKGSPGGSGVKGVQGIQGIAGNPGGRGNPGQKGVQGIQGAVAGKGGPGDKGEKGVQGIQGSAGPKGNVGSRGFRGVQGIQGRWR